MAADPTQQPLAERVVLVTGAAEGIGRAVALAAAAQGATLVLSDHPDADLAAVYDAIESAGGPEPAILPLNLDTADERAARGAAELVGETFGRLDSLVHCAAFAPYLARLDDYDAADWEQVLRINLTAPFLLTQACLPLLRASRDAVVIFTADRVGRAGHAYWGAFAAAKFGLEGLAQVLAEETRGTSPIRVASLDPGVLRTGLRARLYPGEDPFGLPAPETAAPAYLELLRCS
ncbi:SDR family NAD(P)-dependent oxidoreductase [uncultured Thiodictyon sp.]|uniref:SDR family NAD(P)-dependent oxidoreductase n=1 Tax=uncultured Thiodictyon sp. TaxID=1846217 RepID=UPI0025CFE329|nr:SDR family NAD(P)-dependent oxidoreductase [uncultured Thiodictyon sp.]